ncbi:hypothetical protein CGRA01v4_08294 [Colletotrichum graminicola]|nr:hypothetical protein CGRA01v4_08294 [Colletotrichum graminicola]
MSRPDTTRPVLSPRLPIHPSIHHRVHPTSLTQVALSSPSLIHAQTRPPLRLLKKKRPSRHSQLD